MRKVTNLVLYAFSGKDRRPLIAIAPDEAFGAAKVQHAASAEYARNDRAGVAHSSLKLVRETRAADEQGKLTFVEYAECDAATLADKGEAHAALDDVFTTKEGA